jgi:hypothetical protein
VTQVSSIKEFKWHERVHAADGAMPPHAGSLPAEKGVKVGATQVAAPVGRRAAGRAGHTADVAFMTEGGFSGGQVSQMLNLTCPS